MIRQTKTLLSRNYTNALGSKINPKIVVIESDDWGTIRVSSKKNYQSLLKKGYPVDKCAYNINDGLECNKDLEFLFEVLSKVKDSEGKPAKFTINNIVANPDFKKIKESGFENYFFEPFTETLKSYPKHNNVMKLYKQGISDEVIMPQFHGREHVHVSHWLNGLRNNEKKAIDTFPFQMFSVFLGSNSNCNKEYLNSMAYYNTYEKKTIEDSVYSGINLFEKIWGFKSLSVIPACYQWHESLEEIFNKNGIRIIQGGKAQISPKLGSNNNVIIRHYNGEKNKKGQIFTVRNVNFEPSTNLNKDWVNSAMKEISNAFFWRQPAIISSHRLNYIGWLNEKNRTRNLKYLGELLRKIINKWPDTIFISSDQMIKYYN